MIPLNIVILGPFYFYEKEIRCEVVFQDGWEKQLNELLAK